MKSVALAAFLAISLLHAAYSTQGAPTMDLAGFTALLSEVATGWNANDARRAADAFHEDAIYTEPPDRQVYRGRRELFEFFGGEAGRKDWMRMTWHHISFNETTQTGAGEFTFEWPGGRAHGMTSIKLRDGRIAHWREYFRESELAWDDFQGVNRF
ncbi:MAG TPA: nuclear transport factor 2 family protein [Opitutaceae bacterium]|nr:nuclear transport factor 2 family protein [Opitutaceae bacterium]